MAIPTENEIKSLVVSEIDEFPSSPKILFGTHGTGKGQIRWLLTKRKDTISGLIVAVLVGLDQINIDNWILKIDNYLQNKWGYSVSNHKQIMHGITLLEWRIPVDLET